MLLDYQVADKVLRECFKDSTPNDINLYCLYILDSLTSNLKNPKYFQEILASIPLEKLEKIATTDDYQTISIVRKIKKNLKATQNLLKAKS